VVTPQAGAVIDTLFREGEWVPAGSPVVRLLPPANVKVRFFVPEGSLTLFPVGKRLTVRCDGCAAAVESTVSYVSTEPEFTPPIIYSNETRAKLVFMIEARPAAEGASALRPGQPVEVVPQ
jgi:HlyD family secretion protein